MISLFFTAVLTFVPGDRIVWGDKITNALRSELNGTYTCKGLILSKDSKLLHVKGVCFAVLDEDKETGKIGYVPILFNDYISIKDVKGKE